MKVCIYGAGAIGGWLGVALAQAGHPVSMVARGDTLRANWGADPVCRQPDCENVDPFNAFYVVGVILPAVTGLLNGASMSGNLIDPGTAIPVGTIYAVLTWSLCTPRSS